jgi:carboxypeptidase family protein
VELKKSATYIVRYSNYMKWLLLLSAFVLLGAFQALAQEATIVGTVTDPSGAAVPNVNITITNVDTGLVTQFTTNDVGQYVAPHLQIGHYKVRAQGANFKVAEQNDLVLAVADRRRVDFQLQVGSNQETVTVEARPVAIQSDSNEISTVITGKQLSQLATNGRSLYSLVDLTPGASSMQGDFQNPTPMGGDSNVSFNGQRTMHSLYMVDGAEADDRGGAQGSIVIPSQDALSEFRIMTSNYSAEYGLTSGATVTTVVKSGTNQLHSSAWWFGRNDYLNARNYFNPRHVYNADGTFKTDASGNPILNKVNELRFNLWGFNVGGPVTLHPHGGDHKTFFFYNMEWRRLVTGNQPSNRVVPLPATYGGDLSAAVAYPGLLPNGVHVPNFSSLSTALRTKYQNDGLVSGGQFPNNTIPADLLDPNAQALLSAGGPFGGIFPAPTAGDTFAGSAKAPTSVKEEIARVDHTFNSKLAVYGHWISEQISQVDVPTRWSGANVPTSQDTFGNPSYSAVIHAVNTIRPNLLNEIAFNYDGNRINMVPSGLWDLTKTKFQQNKIFGFQTKVLPIIALSNQTGAQFNNNWNPWINTADDYQIRDDVSWTKGAHQFKMGGSWANFRKAQPLQVSPEGNFGFGGTFTGYDFADFLLGLSSSYTEAATEDTRHWNSVSWGAYFQDDWRASRRLTLNLGLRWDGIPHTAEINNMASNWYPNLWDAAGAAAAFPNGGPVPGGNGFANAAGTQICTGNGTPLVAGNSNPLCGSANPFLAAGVPALNGLLSYANGLGIAGKTPGVTGSLVPSHWNNWGPRIGFAYDVTGRGKTVVRAGVGAFYERIQGNDMYQSAAGENLFTANTRVPNVSLSDPHIGVDQTDSNITASALPTTVNSQIALNPARYKNPVTYQYSAGIQQQLSAQTVFSVAYVGNQGHQESYTQNIDVPAYSALSSLWLSGVPANTPVFNYNTILKYPGYSSLVIYQNGENSHYNSVQFEFRSHLKMGLDMHAAYTYAKAIDPTAANGDGGDLDGISNPYAGWQYDQGPGAIDRTHVAFVNFVYDLPIFRNSSNHFAKGVIGGWQMSGIITMESGLPLNVTYTGTTVCSIVQQCGQGPRPDLAGTIRYTKSSTISPSSNLRVLQWFNPSAFAPAYLPGTTIPTWGNLPHNALRGPGRDNWNLAMFKTFAAGERLHFELRAESFNTWNHTQFNGVNTAVLRGVSPTAANLQPAAQAVSGAGQVNSAFDPRVFQLGVKAIF